MALRASETLSKLRDYAIHGEWAPEAGEYSIESNPLTPYRDSVGDWLTMHDNLENRIMEANLVMEENDYVVANCVFGRKGCTNYTG